MACKTISLVAAGAVAWKILRMYNGIEVLAYVLKVQEIEAENVDDDTFTMINVDDDTFTMEQVNVNIVRCLDPVSA